MRVWLTAACAVAVLAASDAYTASNGVPGAAAGAGSGSISGYAISDVHYELTGDSIAGVGFSLDPPTAQTVRVRLAGGGPWSPCSVTGAAATCTTSVPIAAVSRLEVVAAG